MTAPRRQSVDAGELTWFEEVEVAEITEVFGNVAHRLSGYEKRGAMNGERIDARGAISTQFIRTRDRLADELDGMGRRAPGPRAARALSRLTAIR